MRIGSILILFLWFNVNAQTDAINLDKYWKFRRTFLESYVKVGPNQGESLPAGYVVPLACRDNIGGDGTEPDQYNYSEYGEMHWGDGTIRQGHYFTLLATEYALKKKHGLPLEGTINELYYALNAIIRLDLTAERHLDNVYCNSSFYNDFSADSLFNGFMLREDIGEDFCLNFNDPMKFRCTNSAFYENNNAAKLNKPEEYLITKPQTSYQNVPSLDQITSLVIGILMIDKYVDDIFVQPQPSDIGFKLKSAALQIFDNILTYASEREWLYLDANGWPVTNGGGDFAFAAAPLLLAAKRLLPERNYNTKMHRRFALGYNNVQHCITGYGVGGGLEHQEQFCKQYKYYSPFQQKMYQRLHETGCHLGPQNNVYSSSFLDYMRDGLISMDVMRFEGAWDNLIVNRYKNTAEDWEEDHQIDWLPWPLSSIKFDEMQLSGNNATIFFNLGVASGLWDSTEVCQWANLTENRQLELISGLLYDYKPIQHKSFYQSFLNSLNPEGAFFLKTAWPAEVGDSLVQSGGWASEYRWTHKLQQNGGDHASEGIFSNLDYMVFHNLYYLTFEDELEPFQETYECFCDPIVIKDEPNLNEQQRVAQNVLNKKLRHVRSAVKDPFLEKFHYVDRTFSVKDNFNNYQSLGIHIPYYLTRDLRIVKGGTLELSSDLVVCGSKKIAISEGATINLNKGKLQLKQGGVIDLKGEVHITEENQLELLMGSEINLHKNARIFIHDNAELMIKEDATLNFFGGQVVCEHQAKFKLKGKIVMNVAGNLKIDTSNSTSDEAFIIDGGSIVRSEGISDKCTVTIINKNQSEDRIINVD